MKKKHNSVGEKKWADYLTIYDDVLLKTYTYNELLDQNIQIIRNHISQISKNPVNILELGCGTGNLLKKIIDLIPCYPNHSLSCTGIDFVKSALNIAQNKLTGKAALYRGNLGLPNLGCTEDHYKTLRKTQFDIIILNNVFYTLQNNERTILLKEIKKIITQTGIIIISDPKGRPGILPILLHHMKKTGLLKTLIVLIKQKYLLNTLKVIHFNRKYIQRSYHFMTPEEQHTFFKEQGYTIKEFIENAYADQSSITVYSPA